MLAISLFLISYVGKDECTDMQTLAEKAIQKIEEINLLVNRFIDIDHSDHKLISLFEGVPGAALFLYQYAQYNPAKKDEYHEKIATIIENAFEYVAQTPDTITTYCNGITGILWLTEYLRKKEVIDMGDDYLSPGIVAYLNRQSLTQTLARNNCDLLHGGFGFWAFLLECDNLPGKKHFLRQQLDALDKLAIHTSAGRNWRLNEGSFNTGEDDRMHPDPYTSIHLGLAHGICGILILLAKTNMSGYFENETRDSIHQGLEFIKSLKITDPVSVCLYPSIVRNGNTVKAGPLAWCVGDFCVANAFWMGWKATGIEEYKKEALSIINFLNEKDVGNWSNIDAGLCHGSAGIAQMFRRFSWETGNAIYADASNRWMKLTLERAIYTDGYAGYKVFRVPAYGGWKTDYGFLEGITGIGLALLSSFPPKPVDWDRALQIC